MRAARQTVFDAISDDLNLPRAVAALHEAKSYRLWREFDPVLGLDIEDSLPRHGADARTPRASCRRKSWR